MKKFKTCLITLQTRSNICQKHRNRIIDRCSLRNLKANIKGILDLKLLINSKIIFDLNLQSCYNFVKLLLSWSMNTSWIVFVRSHNSINGRICQIINQIQRLSYLFPKIHFAELFFKIWKLYSLLVSTSANK